MILYHNENFKCQKFTSIPLQDKSEIMLTAIVIKLKFPKTAKPLHSSQILFSTYRLLFMYS